MSTLPVGDQPKNSHNLNIYRHVDNEDHVK